MGLATPRGSQATLEIMAEGVDEVERWSSRARVAPQGQNERECCSLFADVETKRRSANMADPAPVLTCDGDAVPLEEARALSRKHECLFLVFGGWGRAAEKTTLLTPPLPPLSLPTLYLAGFALLPWAWVLNAWLFRDATDAVVASNVASSRRGAAAAGVALAAWAAAFSLGGPRVVGASLYDKLNLAGVDLASWGLNF